MFIVYAEIDTIYATNTTPVSGSNEINRFKRTWSFGYDLEMIKERVEVFVGLLYPKFFHPIVMDPDQVFLRGVT